MKIHNNRKEPSNPNIANTIPHSPKKSFLSHGRNLIASFKAKRLAKNEEKLSKLITKREYYCSIPNPTKKNRKLIKHLDAKQLKLEEKNVTDQTKIGIQAIYSGLPKDFFESDLYKDFQKFVQNILSDKDHIYNSTIQKHPTLLEKNTITKKELAILIDGMTAIEKINNSIKSDISTYSILFSAIPNLKNIISNPIDILKKSEDYLSEIEKDNSMHPLTRLLKTFEIRTQQHDIIDLFSTALIQFMDRPQDITFPSPDRLDGLFIDNLEGTQEGHNRTNGIRMRLISPLLTSENFNLFTKEEQTAIIEALTDINDDTKNAALLKTLKECTVSAPCQKPLKDIVNKNLDLSHNGIFERIQKFEYGYLLPSISSNVPNDMEEGLMTIITDKIKKFETAQSQLSTLLTNNPTPKRPSITNDSIANNDAPEYLSERKDSDIVFSEPVPTTSPQIATRSNSMSPMKIAVVSTTSPQVVSRSTNTPIPNMNRRVITPAQNSKEKETRDVGMQTVTVIDGRVITPAQNSKEKKTRNTETQTATVIDGSIITPAQNSKEKMIRNTEIQTVEKEIKDIEIQTVEKEIKDTGMQSGTLIEGSVITPAQNSKEKKTINTEIQTVEKEIKDAEIQTATLIDGSVITPAQIPIAALEKTPFKRDSNEKVSEEILSIFRGIYSFITRKDALQTNKR